MGLALRIGFISSIDPFKQKRKGSSQMGEDQSKVWVFLKKTGKDHLRHGHSGIHTKPHQWDQNKLCEGFRMNRHHGVDENRQIHLIHLFVERPEFFGVEVLPANV